MPVNPVTIVVLSKYADFFHGFRDSMTSFAPSVPCIVVRDEFNFDCPEEERWTLVQGRDPFSMAGNCNIGWKAAPSSHDILYCGDDVRFLAPDTAERLRDLAYSDPLIGILSPRISGGVGNPLQYTPDPYNDLTYSKMYLCFPCVYIKRAVIDTIGYLDEQFSQYGWDDVDYSLRTKNAGFRLAVTSRVVVHHGLDGIGANCTFLRSIGREGVNIQDGHNRELFYKKWGHASLE